MKISCGFLLAATAAAAAACLWQAQPARAQYATETTQLLNYATLIRQLQSESLQLEGIIRSIQSLNFHSVGEVISGMDSVVGSLGRANLVSYDAVRAERDFYSMYRDVSVVRNITPGTRDLNGLISQYNQMLAATGNAMQEATRIQSQAVTEMNNNQRRIGATVAASDAAPGTTSAVQAGNQLVANMTAELTRMHSTMISYNQAQMRVAQQHETSAEESRILAGQSLLDIGTGPDGPRTDPFRMAPQW